MGRPKNFSRETTGDAQSIGFSRADPGAAAMPVVHGSVLVSDHHPLSVEMALTYPGSRVSGKY